MDMLLIGILIGFCIGFAVGVLQKQHRVLATAPEEDLVREVKRRRYARKLADLASAEVDNELSVVTTCPTNPIEKEELHAS